MSRRKKLSLLSLAGVTVAAAGIMAYPEILGVPARFDARFYAQAAPAGPFSDQEYAAVLETYVDEDGLVAYAALKEDRKRLDDYVLAVAGLGRQTYEGWDEPRRIAFWLNAYNALTLKAVLDHYPIRGGLLRSVVYPRGSIRQVPGVRDKLQFLVMGERTTLDHIEQGILRETFDEPRIHMALACAAMGGPPLRNEPYDGPRLDEQLDDQTRRFLRRPAGLRIDLPAGSPGRKAGTVHLSSIFRWFVGDFIRKHAPKEQGSFGERGDAERAVLSFISGYLSADQAACLRAGDYDATYLNYDWSLNERAGPVRGAEADEMGRRD